MVSKSPEDTFLFLTDLANFEQLMPDTIDKFEMINDDRFLFALKGMPEIVLERKSQEAPNTLVLGAASEKLPFTLKADISILETGKSKVALHFNGEFNA